MKGVYQILFGCVLQIIKQAAGRIITSRISTNIFSSMDSGEGNAKIPTDAKNTIKDNAQAGIPAKRDFFVSFFIIVCLRFNTYVA